MLIRATALVVFALPAADVARSAEPTVRIESRVLKPRFAWPRIAARAVTLPDGSALIVGGGFASVVRFDPETETFTTLEARMSRRRWRPTVTRLTDGRVLIAGGVARGAGGATAEVFDPRTHTFGPAFALARSRIDHTATRLADGRVLLAGGDATAEIVDPLTMTTTEPFRLSRRRRGHTANRLPDGRVLLAGGGAVRRGESADVGYRSAEIVDVRGRRSAPLAGLMRDERDEHVAWRLADGRILLAGGQRHRDGRTHARSDLFNASQNRFTPGPNLPVDCQDAAILAIGDGRILIIGGESDDGPGGRPDRVLDTVILFEPAAMRFVSVGRLKIPRDDFAACRLGDGRILLTGGLTRGDVPAVSAELLTVHVSSPGATRPTTSIPQGD